MKNWQKYKLIFLERRMVWFDTEIPNELSENENKNESENERPSEIREGVSQQKESSKELIDEVNKLNIEKTDIEKEEGTESVTVENFRKALESALKKKNAENLSPTLLKALSDHFEEPGVHNQNLDNFSKFLKDKKITSFSIDDGYFKFFDNEGEPLQADYSLNIADPKQAVEQVDENEKRVNEILETLKAPSKNVDTTRYSSMISGIMEYSLEDALHKPPLKLNLSFNDLDPLVCEFYLAKDGRYILSWNGAYFPYDPGAKGEIGLKRAKEYFVKNLSNGFIFYDIQKFYINKVESFEQWGMSVDEGPEDIKGSTYYEFKWKGENPKVWITVMPHGDLKVNIKCKKINPNGSGEYTFTAGGFQSMIRTLKRLQRLAETDEGPERDALLEEDSDARFFENPENTLSGRVDNGHLKIKDHAKNYLFDTSKVVLDTGRVLNVSSVRDMDIDGTLREGFFDKGHLIRFDWMEKMNPPQKLQILRNNVGYFEVYLIPSKQKLGEISSEPGETVVASQAYVRALELVAEQKAFSLKENVQEEYKNCFKKVLDEYNRKSTESSSTQQQGVDSSRSSQKELSLVNGVTICAVSEKSGYFYLSQGENIAPVLFCFGTVNKPNKAEFKRAMRQGYLKKISKQSAEPSEGAIESKDLHSPHDMSLKEFGETIEGLSADNNANFSFYTESFNLLNTSEYLDKDRVFLSNVPENKRNSNVRYFNVMIGDKAPNLRSATIRFKVGSDNKYEVGIVNGWNNREAVPIGDSVIVTKVYEGNPVDTVISRLRDHQMAQHDAIWVSGKSVQDSKSDSSS